MKKFLNSLNLLEEDRKLFNHPVERKTLREFGWVTGALFVILFGILFPFLFTSSFPFWPWWIAGVLWGFAWLAPEGLKWVYQTWMTIGQILGWINTRLVLGIIFYLLITPIGFVKRIVSENPLYPKSRVPNSYRRLSPPRPPEHMKYPF